MPRSTGSCVRKTVEMSRVFVVAAAVDIDDTMLLKFDSALLSDVALVSVFSVDDAILFEFESALASDVFLASVFEFKIPQFPLPSRLVGSCTSSLRIISLEEESK